MSIVKQQFTITYEREIDVDSGEILKTTIIGSSDIKPEKKKAVKKDSDTEAKVYLEDNKLKLNSLAVELMKINPGDRIDIQYTKQYPLIGLSETFGNPDGGTKLTKSNTLSFRGKKSEALQKYGTEFKVLPAERNQFVLDSGKEIIDEPELKGDENVNVGDDLDFNLDSLLDDASEATEIPSSMFQL